MLKVSFKDKPKKVQTFNDKYTIVTLSGTMALPKGFIGLMPVEILDWAYNHPVVDFYDSIDKAHIIVQGKSVCADGDTFDALLGERIAESRAKIRLYRFMTTLLRMLRSYYLNLVLGKQTSVEVEGNDCISMDFYKYEGLYLKERQHLKKLLGNESDTESSD